MSEWKRKHVHKWSLGNLFTLVRFQNFDFFFTPFFFFFAVSFHLSVFLPLPEAPSHMLAVLSIYKATFQPISAPSPFGKWVALQHRVIQMHLQNNYSSFIPRLAIWINVSLIKPAAGLSCRTTTIKSHGTRAQKRVPLKHPHLLPTSPVRRSGACTWLPNQHWLLIKWPWYVRERKWANRCRCWSVFYKHVERCEAGAS